MITGDDICFLDANTIIAIIERGVPFTPGQVEFLNRLENATIRCVSNELVLAECLVKPIREQNDALASDIANLLDGRSNLPLIAFDRPVFLAAAELRAVTGMKLPDALHVASALVAGCTVFISADRGIRLPPSIRRFAFDDLELQTR